MSREDAAYRTTSHCKKRAKRALYGTEAIRRGRGEGKGEAKGEKKGEAERTLHIARRAIANMARRRHGAALWVVFWGWLLGWFFWVGYRVVFNGLIVVVVSGAAGIAPARNAKRAGGSGLRAKGRSAVWHAAAQNATSGRHGSAWCGLKYALIVLG